jgi:hypothetical protein
MSYSEFETEIIAQLTRLVQIVSSQNEKLDQLLKLFNQYNAEYLIEMEKEGMKTQG